MTPAVALTAAIPGTGTRSSGRRRHERAREGGGHQSGAPPQMMYARRRPMDWKGGSKRRTQDAKDGRWPRREDASSLAREMHEERRAGRRGGEAKVATGCDELGGATHDELPSSIRRLRQEQHSADLTCSARPAVVVGRP
jgi:hypothetical protein